MKLAIRTGLSAEYAIRASVDLDSSSNQFSPRFLRSAAVILERVGFPPSSQVMHGVLVGDTSKKEAKMYCHYEIAVTLTWPLTLSDLETLDSVEGSYAGPKICCID